MKDLSFIEKIQAVWAIIGTAIFNWSTLILFGIPVQVFGAIYQILPEGIKQFLSKLFPNADFDYFSWDFDF